MPNQKGKKQDFGGKKGGFGDSDDSKFVKKDRHAESDTKMHKQHEGAGKRTGGGAVSDVKGDGGKERTAKVWEHINKSVAKDKRGDVREGLPKDVQPVVASVEPARPVQQVKVPVQSISPVNPFEVSSEVDSGLPMEPSDEGDSPIEEPEPIVEPVVPEQPVVVPGSPVVKATPRPTPKAARKDPTPEPVVEVVEVKRSDSAKKVERGPKKVAKKTKVVSKSVSKVSVEVPVKQEQPQVQEFKEDLWDILAQAGITKKRIVWGVVVFVLIIFVLYFFVFNDEGVSIPDVVDVPGEVVELSSPSASENIITSYLLGLEFSTTSEATIYEKTALDDALMIGGSESDSERFVEYVAVLRSLQNIYDTDVYALLDRTLDRRGEIEVHLREMNDLLLEAETIFNEINLILNSLDEAYGVVGLNRDNAENQFFNSAEGLYGEETYRELGVFVDASQEGVEIKAYFNAYKILRDMYLNSINVLTPRYEDILVNKEAIIKGIRIFDIPGSDIETIIRLSE